ncbi:NUDIX hydrolase domain-like protein [Mrakia frigida]|uniref:NUDIX hydrolase n=1 Tax=Mrakia frigida TaxID=29902 RepID=UPI003FCC1B5B
MSPSSQSLRVVCVAIPYNPNTDEILMVSSRKHPLLWILPKGGWEHKLNESLAEAARREAGEEAGIISRPFPSSPSPPTLPLLTTSDAKTLYHFFPLEVSSLATTFLEVDERRREWVSWEEAKRRVGEWAALGEKKHKEKKHEGEEKRRRKMELEEGLDAWRVWRDGGGGAGEQEMEV